MRERDSDAQPHVQQRQLWGLGCLVGQLRRVGLQPWMWQRRPRWHRLAVSEHHAVREQPPEWCWLLEPGSDTQQFTDMQLRQLRRLGWLGRLVRKLRPHELHCGLHQPQQKPRRH